MAAKKARKARKAAKSRSTGAARTKAGFVSTVTDDADIPDYVVVELRYEAPVAFSAKRFSAPAAAEPQADSLNEVLSKFDIKSMRSQFRPARGRDQIACRGGRNTAVRAAAVAVCEAGNGYRFHPERFCAGRAEVGRGREEDRHGAETPESGVGRLSWRRVLCRRCRPDRLPGAATSNLRKAISTTRRTESAPPAVWGLAGAKGSGITICDIEGNWNRQHEDLPSGIPLLGGTVINDLGWRNHGTAVLGEMVSIPDARGCVGISHQAKGAVHSAVINGVFNAAGAISNAAAQLKKGDVILIELHAPGPTGNYVAMQYWSDIFSAIKAAVEKGITVVEAAGNGNENFDAAIYNNTGLQKDSGAIVVGAGVPPTNHVDFDGFGAGLPSYASLGVPRSRIFFSNYGKIVNVQGWGWHVTSLGYGDAQGGASENTWYTLRFSGTSSASPIVTGAVACLQGRAKAKNGAPMTPAKVRDILMTTGTPQQAGPGVPLVAAYRTSAQPG